MVEKLKVSDQLCGCLMICLQKSLMEQADIVPMLKEMELVVENGEVVVLNPPKSLEIKE